MRSRLLVLLLGLGSGSLVPAPALAEAGPLGQSFQEVLREAEEGMERFVQEQPWRADLQSVRRQLQRVAEWTQGGRRLSERQARWLAQHPSVQVTVEGHADERGTREYNLALGQRRANAARDTLVALGVSGARIQTISYGKDRPAALGSNEDAWAQNRRAVTVVR